MNKVKSNLTKNPNKRKCGVNTRYVEITKENKIKEIAKKTVMQQESENERVNDRARKAQRPRKRSVEHERAK